VPVCYDLSRCISSHSPYPSGITGLATAIALRKLPNVDVQIYERATELRELGQVIALNPNGLRTLEKLGLHNVLSDEIGYRCPSGIPQTFRCGFPDAFS
jgi:salicylate hydroxylase